MDCLPQPVRLADSVDAPLASAPAVDTDLSPVVRGLEAGRHLVDWDERDVEGCRVAAGIYFVRVSGPRGFVDTSKIAVLE
jgi:hypothetical protein